MHKLTIPVSFAVLLVASAGLVSACASGAQELRPETITGNAAIGEAFACTEDKLKDDLNPFTVDWPDGDRAALESAMKRGVAVVNLTCDGPKVLKACMVQGDYAYAGVELKTKLVKMSDQGEAAVNLGGRLSVGFQSELKQGRSLMLAYSIAGTESTTVTTVGGWQLKGRCDGATHFVFGSTVGAFAMETAESGSASSATDVLVGNASASGSSEKSTRTTDGDPTSCEGASFKDNDKRSGCAALMRVDLMLIDQDAARPSGDEEEDRDIDPVVRVTSCPSGYVWNNNACAPEAKVTAKLCAEGDVADCKTQCEAGSVESCDRWSKTLISNVWDAELEYDDWQDMVVARGDVIASWAEDIDTIDSACDEDMPHACTVMGYHWAGKWKEQEALAKFGAGCAYGDSGACYVLADVEARPDALIELGKMERLPYLENACNKGIALACGMWSSLFVEDWGYDEIAFDPAVASMSARACYGGKLNYCSTAAAMRATTEARCVELMQPFDGIGADLAQAEKSCGDKFASGLAGDEGQMALLLNFACDAGRQNYCDYIDAQGLRVDLDALATEGE